MDREELKQYLHMSGYTKIEDHRFKHICEIYHKMENNEDLFVSFFNNRSVAGKKNIRYINDAIRKRVDFFVGNSKEKHFLNIIKVGNKNEHAPFAGKDMIITSPGKDYIGRINGVFSDVKDEIKRENRTKLLINKKYEVTQGVLGSKDSLPIVTLMLIFVSVYCYIKFFRYSSVWAISPKALKDGNLIKVISSMFMHGSIMHILFNMLALYSYGKALERREGHVIMLVAYMVSGMASMFGTAFVSLVLGKMDASTVGESGAIYGIIGSYIVSEALLPKGIRNPRELITGTIYMLIMSAFMRGVDNTCHVIGFISGIIIMLLLKLIKRSMNEAKYYKYSKELIKYGKDFIVPCRTRW